jgi:hypothetical protein
VALPVGARTSAAAVEALLRTFYRPQCHPMLLSSGVNSPAAVAVNVSRLIMLAAAKLVCVLQRPQLQGVVTPASLARYVTRVHTRTADVSVDVEHYSAAVGVVVVMRPL